MAGLFPLRFDVDDERNGRTVVDISGETASTVIPALASETARDLLVRLNDAPETASGLAERSDTSLQNVLYHLGSLREAGLVRVVDTWYSSRGVEMKVYAPTFESLVIVVGTERTVDDVEKAIRTTPAD